MAEAITEENDAVASAAKSDVRFVEFTRHDVTRLADFNAHIRSAMENPEEFYAHDIEYYQRNTGSSGWTFGFEDDEGIASAYSFEIDLQPYRKKMRFPAEAVILNTPAIWAGSFAISPRHRKSGLHEKINIAVPAMLKTYGVGATIGGASPANFKYRLPGIACGDKTLVGIYYDDTGWNHLSTATRESCHPEHFPEKVDVWVSSGDEARYQEAIEDNMIGITARETADGFELGFGKVRP